MNGVTLQADLAECPGSPDGGHAVVSGNLLMSGTASVVGLSTNANPRHLARSGRRGQQPGHPDAAFGHGHLLGCPLPNNPSSRSATSSATLRKHANGVTNSTVVTAARGNGSGHPAWAR
jgi:hypothetical protein